MRGQSRGYLGSHTPRRPPGQNKVLAGAGVTRVPVPFSSAGHPRGPWSHLLLPPRCPASPQATGPEKRRWCRAWARVCMGDGQCPLLALLPPALPGPPLHPQLARVGAGRPSLATSHFGNWTENYAETERIPFSSRAWPGLRQPKHWHRTSAGRAAGAAGRPEPCAQRSQDLALSKMASSASRTWKILGSQHGAAGQGRFRGEAGYRDQRRIRGPTAGATCKPTVSSDKKRPWMSSRNNVPLLWQTHRPRRSTWHTVGAH